MRYSVLMSVYKNDNPEHLASALQSIYEDQTKKPDEIVVVFDGKLTDALYSVLNEFASDKEGIVKYYPQETNRGLGEALRIGSGYCTGDYIFRMDSDDISDARRFEVQAAFAQDNPDADVIGTDIAEFQQSICEKMRVRACPTEHADIAKMSKRRNPMNHVSVCIKREALMECGGYESLLLLEDYYLWLKMIATGHKLANINQSLVYVRIGNGFDERRQSNVRVKGWKVLQKYMLEHKMITIIDAAVNMFYIRAFTYCPTWIRKMAYSKFLRK